MKNEEKRIIGVSFLILLAVIVWAVFVNINKKSKQDTLSTKIINSVSDENASSTNVTSTNVVASAVTVPMKNNDQGVPIVMYHSVDDNQSAILSSGLRITKENFASQMKYLKDNDFHTLTMDEINDFLINNKPIPQKSVALTFDDGYEDNYSNVYPILKSYGFKATVFVVVKSIGENSNFLTASQLNEMQQNGMDIESGTDENVKLADLTSDNQLASLKESKTKLEELLNKKVNYVSYPFGSYNSQTLEDVKNAGYALGLSRDGKWTYKTDGQFKLSRVFIGPTHTESDFENRINNKNY
ncbi:polysaccharide deacetylase family protein [Clostridium akagii]|uniref:polysaccharide deacetylase family protein n=1 Tax=Clostridium akagii TaxID=91623 RepID=UPI0004792A42|nr:polysaccharide deacetylase family protein [Clostridium akagii]